MSVAALSLFLSKMIPFGTWVHARASTNHHTRFNLRSRGRGARWPVLSLWDRAKQLCNLKGRPCVVPHRVFSARRVRAHSSPFHGLCFHTKFSRDPRTYSVLSLWRRGCAISGPRCDNGKGGPVDQVRAATVAYCQPGRHS